MKAIERLAESMRSFLEVTPYQPIAEWVETNIDFSMVPGAAFRRIDFEMYPHTREPISMWEFDGKIRELTVCGIEQHGKTQIETKDTIIDPVTGKSVTGLWGVCHTGDVWCVPTKAADTYDWTVYTITETGKHSSKNQAGWVASEAINSIVTKPSLGDFGLTAKLGGNWKVDNVEVYYDGKHWVASRTYTKSGDAQGWDQELYGEVK